MINNLKNGNHELASQESLIDLLHIFGGEGEWDFACAYANERLLFCRRADFFTAINRLFAPF